MPLVELVRGEHGNTMIALVELPGPRAKSPSLRSTTVVKIVSTTTPYVDSDAKVGH
jgi:hypothetical protein